MDPSDYKYKTGRPPRSCPSFKENGLFLNDYLATTISTHQGQLAAVGNNIGATVMRGTSYSRELCWVS